jgi:hypothetical protein
MEGQGGGEAQGVADQKNMFFKYSWAQLPLTNNSGKHKKSILTNNGAVFTLKKNTCLPGFEPRSLSLKKPEQSQRFA